MITVTKRFGFCYGHKLPGYSGKCANYHGHNADLEVTVKGVGKQSLKEGRYPTMVEDFGEIKRKTRGIIDRLDHKDLTEFFETYNQPPTAEVIALWIFYRLTLLYGSNVVKVKLTEGPDSWTTVVAGPNTDALIYDYFRRNDESKRHIP